VAAPEESKARTLHDRLFKEFLHRFLPDFLKLFFPEEAARLNFATLKFLDKELVINLPSQELRITDTVAELQTWQGEPETIIIHVEVEGREKRTLPQRMSEYYALLRILRRKAVLPIALILLPKAGGLAWKTYTEELFGHEVLRFQYGQVGIRDLSSPTYLARHEPVAAALAALMKANRKRLAEVKLAALRVVVESKLSDGDKLFLVTLINTYLPTSELPAAREEIMQNLAEIEMSWGDKLREEGREEGELKGELKGKCEVLLRLLAFKFGALPDAFVGRIKAITEGAQLDALIEQALSAASLADIKLPALTPEPQADDKQASVITQK
jgi:predicted transposase YdaD